MKLGKTIQEFFYSLSTSDKYSEFDSRKSFNRVNKPDETNLLYSHQNQSSALLSDGNINSDHNAGVHEVRLAWRHIKNWLYRYAPDLNASLQSRCTESDLNEFQKDLNVRLPQCLVEFYKLTDGQSSLKDTNSYGLVYGLKLLSIDEVVVMTERWRKIADYTNARTSSSQQVTGLKRAQINESKASLSLDEDSGLDLSNAKVHSKRVVSDKGSAKAHDQSSIPPHRIRDTFAHPMWIPLLTDEVGNYVGIDLSPPTGSDGVVGQVILFGREFDCKYLVADTFGDFLLIFANDLEIGNWEIKTPHTGNSEDLMIGSEGELVFVDKKTKEEKNYLDVLKSRSIEKWVNSLKSENGELSEEARHTIEQTVEKPEQLPDLKFATENEIYKNMIPFDTSYNNISDGNDDDDY
ncbi:Piso0_000669 [Millerozyma farinosa CBS 7064]|uniref:Piso0_000669 protein n=1 Tax=Pichia sorbitophila (strain ATCC MYA-4447 / BCRC 22081 / CBS 7064 / NBRC 10061 / NRRL Y-12695) TaxID=559304 RepID=G8YPQ8_PICSO|nr:Piso0_000669 [Millerozyma farinosa CBS 7064]